MMRIVSPGWGLMDMGKHVLLFVIAIIAFSSIATLFATAQLSEEEAMNKFQALGCTSCHNGQVAADWNKILDLFESWKGKYASLDEAVKAEVEYFGGQKFNSYDEMMNVMAQNVGRSMDDPEFKALYDFFKALYEGQPQETPTETPTETTPETTPPATEQTTPPETSPTQSPTQTTPPASPTETETRETPTPTETEEQGVSFGVAAGIAIIIIIIVVGAIFLATRR